MLLTRTSTPRPAEYRSPPAAAVTAPSAVEQAASSPSRARPRASIACRRPRRRPRHAYALTAHKAEGATLPAARALLVDDTSRPGLYVMLSRARHTLHGYLTARTTLTDHPDDETWLPTLPDPTGPLPRLTDRLTRSAPEQLAHQINPHAAPAHHLRMERSLAELIHLDTLHNGHPAIRLARTAAERAFATTAPTTPPADLVARIGPRPPNGPDRALWDRAVVAHTTHHARHPTPTPTRHDTAAAADTYHGAPPSPAHRESAERAARLTRAAETNHQARRTHPPTHPGRTPTEAATAPSMLDATIT